MRSNAPVPGFFTSFLKKLPDPHAPQPGLQDGDILQTCRIDLKWICTQNHKVSKESGLDLSLGMLLKAGISTGLGEAVDGLFHRESLLGEVGGAATQILPGDGALDPGEDIRASTGQSLPLLTVAPRSIRVFQE